MSHLLIAINVMISNPQRFTKVIRNKRLIYFVYDNIYNLSLEPGSQFDAQKDQQFCIQYYQNDMMSDENIAKGITNVARNNDIMNEYLFFPDAVVHEGNARTLELYTSLRERFIDDITAKLFYEIINNERVEAY